MAAVAAMAVAARAALAGVARRGAVASLRVTVLPPLALAVATGGAAWLPPVRAVSATAAAYAPKGGKKGAPAAAAAAATVSAPADDDGDDVDELAGGVTLKDVAAAMAKHVDYAKRELGKLRGSSASPGECFLSVALPHHDSRNR